MKLKYVVNTLKTDSAAFLGKKPVNNSSAKIKIPSTLYRVQ